MDPADALLGPAPGPHPGPTARPTLDADLVDHARHLLALLARISGLRSTYLTNVDWAGEVQHILLSHNTGTDLVIPEGLAVPWRDTLCRRSLATGIDRTEDVAGQFPDCDAAAALGIRSFISVAVLDVDGSIYGTLCGASNDEVAISDDVHATMVALGEMVSLQLRERAASREIGRQAEELTRANARLQELVLTDALTGLPNRRGVLEALERLAGAARRNDQRVGLVWLDVDQFKGVNDRFGHHAGDDALRLVADSLRSVIRAQDVAGRVGGDEFLVLLPDTDEVAAASVAERLRRRVAQAEGQAFGPISISAGTASTDGRDPEAALVAADRALYVAKTGGRDRVATHATR